MLKQEQTLHDMTGIGVIVIVTRFSFSSNVKNVGIKVNSYVDINNNEPATVSHDDVAVASLYIAGTAIKPRCNERHDRRKPLPRGFSVAFISRP